MECSGCAYLMTSKEDVGNLEKFVKVCKNTLNNHAASRKSMPEVIMYHL